MPHEVVIAYIRHGQDPERGWKVLVDGHEFMARSVVTTDRVDSFTEVTITVVARSVRRVPIEELESDGG